MFVLNQFIIYSTFIDFTSVCTFQYGYIDWGLGTFYWSKVMLPLFIYNVDHLTNYQWEWQKVGNFYARCRLNPQPEAETLPWSSKSTHLNNIFWYVVLIIHSNFKTLHTFYVLQTTTTHSITINKDWVYWSSQKNV